MTYNNAVCVSRVFLLRHMGVFSPTTYHSTPIGLYTLGFCRTFPERIPFLVAAFAGHADAFTALARAGVPTPLRYAARTQVLQAFYRHLTLCWRTGGPDVWARFTTGVRAAIHPHPTAHPQPAPTRFCHTHLDSTISCPPHAFCSFL